MKLVYKNSTTIDCGNQEAVCYLRAAFFNQRNNFQEKIMDMQNLLCKLAGKKEAIEANTNTWDMLRNSYNKGVLSVLDEVLEELEAVSGIKAPVKPEHRKVVHMDQRVAR